MYPAMTVKRRAQFVRSVGGKLSHALFGLFAMLERRRDAGDGIVERRGEVGHFVAAAHDKASLREIAVGQRLAATTSLR